jgi:aromatic-L-amino-acid decarboxylase
MGAADFLLHASQIASWISAYHARLREQAESDSADARPPALPVRSRVQPGDVLRALPARAPARPVPFDRVWKSFERTIVPGLTHWQSPAFAAYFPCNTSEPSILADLLCAGLGVNAMLWATSPSATELELRTLEWMRQALGLPETFRAEGPRATGGGVIQGTASEGTLCALLAARQRLRSAGVRGRMTAYCSSQAHSSVVKAGMIAGVPVRQVPPLVQHGRALSIDARELARMMALDARAGLRPGFVCATLGTTGTMAFDDLPAVARAIDARIGGARAPAPVWLHVDGAMAGAAWVCPELRAPLAGVARADSLCFNPHKWLLTGFDCDLFWTRDRASLTGALSILPEYLRTRPAGAQAQGDEWARVDYRDWGVPLGRRFRALKLWFVLNHYGLSGLQAYIRQHLRLTQLAEGLLGADGRIELIGPRHESSPLVVFAPRAMERETLESANARAGAWLERINATGRALLSHTVIPVPGGGQRYVLRMALGATHTSERSVRQMCRVVRASMEG